MISVLGWLAWPVVKWTMPSIGGFLVRPDRGSVPHRLEWGLKRVRTERTLH